MCAVLNGHARAQRVTPMAGHWTYCRDAQPGPFQELRQCGRRSPSGDSVRAQIWLWAGDHYEKTVSLEPLLGYWVHAIADAEVDVRLP